MKSASRQVSFEILKVDEIRKAGKYTCVGGPFGSALSRKHYIEEPGVPVIRGTNLGEDRIQDEGYVYVSEEKADELHRNLAFPGDLVFTQRGTLGQVALIPEDARFPKYVVSQSQMKLAVNEDVADPYYIYIFFRSALAKRIIADRAITGGVPHINLGILKDIEIPLPSMERQKAIVETVSDLDGKIELNRQTNQTLEQIAQAIFKSLFVDFEPVKAKQHARALGGNDEQTERAAQAVIAGAVNLYVITSATDLSALDRRLIQALGEKLTHQTEAQREQLASTASLFSDQLVESELGLIPEGWVVGGMKDCCLRVESGGTPKRSKSDFWNGDIRWLSSGEVRNIIILDTKEKITEAGLKNSSAKLWPSGSIVVAMYGATAGQICLLVNGMTANQACCALIPKKHYQSFIFFSARRSIESLSGMASGSAQQNLNKSLVAEHRVLISSEKVLEAFEIFTSSLLGVWIKNIERNVVLSELRDALLPKLLTGELAPNQLHQTRN